jgi:hypothetical protein
LLTFILTPSFPPFHRDVEEKKEEKKKKKKKRRKTSKTAPGPGPADTSVLAMPSRATKEEEILVSEDAQPINGADVALAPEVTEPPSVEGQSEARGVA